MTVNGLHPLSPDFKWDPDYDDTLEQIADTDIADTEWTHLREIIKYKINSNIALFLSESPTRSTQDTSSSSNPSLSPLVLSGGGLRLPPFPPRERIESNLNEAPKSLLNEDEANEMKEVVYTQLHEFEGNPPFTIQRVCELCLRPKQHYKSVGKYLRAVEKSLLVTSTCDVFPPSSGENDESPLNPASSIRFATTPLFSPIPFLHDDARRSSSRSPPTSPLILGGRQLSGIPGEDIVQVDPPPQVGRALGLVDELDDPSPGHLSDHPHAITSVTSSGTINMQGSLEERFVKSTLGENGDGESVRLADVLSCQ